MNNVNIIVSDTFKTIMRLINNASLILIIYVFFSFQSCNNIQQKTKKEEENIKLESLKTETNDLSEKQLQFFLNQFYSKKLSHDFYLPMIFNFEVNKGMYSVNYLRKDKKNIKPSDTDKYKPIEDLENYYIVLYYRKPSDILNVTFKEEDYNEDFIYAEKFEESLPDTIHNKNKYFEYNIKKPSYIYVYIYDLDKKQWNYIDKTILKKKTKAGDVDLVLDFVEMDSENTGYNYINSFFHNKNTQQ